MTIMRLPSAIKAELEKRVVEGYPYETCGVVTGRQIEGEVHVAGMIQASNLNRERANDRYELDPADFLAADQQARAEGIEIVGIWHSHPDHPARPSETDRNAAWEGYSYLIASVICDGIADLRSWRLEGTEFVEEDLLIWQE